MDELTDTPEPDVLRDRLRSVGIDPGRIGDPHAAWLLLRERFGDRVTLIDRYALEALPRGIRPEQLDAATRARLGVTVLHAQVPGLDLRPEAARHDGRLEVAAYDPIWPARFATWRHRLAAALGATAIRIEHIGSTSVPDLAAKPIVDIQVSVRDPEDEAQYLSAVERCTLVLRSREPGHRYFRPPSDRPRDVHLHVCAAGSEWERNHLLFRDYLRAQPKAADAYGQLKRILAERYGDDRLAYTDAKSVFILDALDAAERWADDTGWELPPVRQGAS